MALTMLDTELTGLFSPRGPSGMVLLLRLTHILAFTLSSGQADFNVKLTHYPEIRPQDANLMASNWLWNTDLLEGKERRHHSGDADSLISLLATG